MASFSITISNLADANHLQTKSTRVQDVGLDNTAHQKRVPVWRIPAYQGAIQNPCVHRIPWEILDAEPGPMPQDLCEPAGKAWRPGGARSVHHPRFAANGEAILCTCHRRLAMGSPGKVSVLLRATNSHRTRVTCHLIAIHQEPVQCHCSELWASKYTSAPEFLSL